MKNHDLYRNDTQKKSADFVSALCLYGYFTESIVELINQSVNRRLAVLFEPLLKDAHPAAHDKRGERFLEDAAFLRDVLVGADKDFFHFLF